MHANETPVIPTVSRGGEINRLQAIVTLCNAQQKERKRERMHREIRNRFNAKFHPVRNSM